jgi:hypothetical protein
MHIASSWVEKQYLSSQVKSNYKLLLDGDAIQNPVKVIEKYV